MMAFFDIFMRQMQDAWQPHYWLLMGVSVLFALALRRATRGMVPFTAQILFLFVLLLTGSAVATGLGSSAVAGPLHAFAILVFGMLLIRQASLVFFRLIIPKLGMRPPRILEEILILLAYGAWVLIRLASAGLDLGSLVASTAVITAVLAFAMQDTLGNILAGLALQLDHSVHIGDWIKIDDVSGQVVQVQWRHTAVRTLFGEMVLIPNSQLMKSRVMLTGGDSVPRRLSTVFFYCDSATRPGDVIEAIQYAFGQAEFDTIAADPPPVCVVTDFAGGLITYAVRYWLTDPLAVGHTASLVRQHIHAVFQRQGWQMAAPGMELSVASRRMRETRQQKHEQQGLEQRFQLLRGIELFSPLTSDELHSLASRLKPIPYVAGSILARQGDAGDCLFIVASGRATVWLETRGSRHMLAEVGQGEVIGEMSLMTGEARQATVTARTHVNCYVLDKSVFQETLEQRPELADAFAQLLTARKQELTALHDNVSAIPEAVEKAAILARIRNLFRV